MKKMHSFDDNIITYEEKQIEAVYAFKNLYFVIAIFMIESELTILTHYEQLGIFFFYASLILILCNDLLVNKHRKNYLRTLYIHFLVF